MSFNWRRFFEENIQYIITMLFCILIIFILLSILQYYSGVEIIPKFFPNTISTAFVYFIFLFTLGVILWDYLYKFLLDAIKFLSLDYDVDRTEFNYNYGRWYVRYLIFSSLYFFILMVQFNFLGYENEGILMFLPWFGLMFLRVLHHFNGNVGKEMGKFVIYLLIPLGILEIIGHVIFLQEKIIFEKWPVFICVGLAFIFAILSVESIIKLVKHILIEIKLKRFPPRENNQDYYEP